ncbi:unnamed protein product [Didymodactylos carnosus]|uniref:FLYWCH-type domain-containing protein n=1 Tax=Didymodactylos carnosus TaxID=1234261 RepID=A0A815TUD7_9BILA|nr:unnamed protein product [Didymodactylos carnosus]CAF1506829.1 unnamed protein product [Didymodactylos carnosus]CAF4016567.1 unnamed protein product [Didymodactylos carnosus]CAF4367955.1 unnamed protein product [Didymodactylos carnosus]
MPVTTRSGVLRSQIAEETTLPANSTTSTQVSKSMVISKTTRKFQSQQKQKQLKAQPPTTSIEPETCSTVEQQLPPSQIETTVENNNYHDHEDERLGTEMDISLESLFSDQQLILPTTHENEIAEQQTVKNDYPMLSLGSSNEDDDDMYPDDSNTIMNKPVVKGDITTGTSTRGDKMIFMNSYGYLYISETKNTVGWRCVRRNENCKAVVYTLKESGLQKLRRKNYPPLPNDQKFVVPTVY